jgi:hypothetical protein
MKRKLLLIFVSLSLLGSFAGHSFAAVDDVFGQPFKPIETLGSKR